MASQQPNGEAGTAWKGMLAGVVAVVALAIFFVGVAYTADNAGGKTTETQWSRWVYLLTGVEVVTFTSVGWLFGSEVNRKRAESAEKRADQKDKEAAVADARGHELAGAIRGAAAAQAVGDAAIRALDGGEAVGRLTGLVEMAQRYFP